MTKLVEFIPNFSEGRRQEVIDQISEAAQSVPGAKLINVNVEPSYNGCRRSRSCIGSRLPHVPKSSRADRHESP